MLSLGKRGIFALALLLLLSACGGTEETPPPPSETAVTFSDDLGREITVDRPQRVACLIGSFADLWYLAGGEDTLVAAAHDAWTYFDLPLDEAVADLGATKELNLEQLLACEPDLILASCNTASQMALEPTLSGMGLPTAYFDVTTFADYLRVLALCTRLTGCGERFDAYGTAIQTQVEDAIARADGSRPSVLYIRATGSSCKARGSEGSVLGEMLHDLDCENIADRDNGLLEDLSLEVILQEDPDFIFVVYQSADPDAARKVMETTLLTNPAWDSLAAVREGRCHVMDSRLYNVKPNEKWGDAYDGLADILYPAA